MDQRIKWALEIMENNYHDQSLIKIAAEIHLSQSRFEHLFKQEVGQTYRSYLEKIRVAKAKDLLADLSLGIKEVASKVGYLYPYNLARAFKKRFGQTPYQYRKEMPHQVLIKIAGQDRG